MHTHTYMCIHIYIRTYLYIHTHTYTRYILTYTHIHKILTYTHTYTHIHMYIHTYTQIHTYVHTYIHTYIHTFTHNIGTYIHRYMHTYTHNIRTYIHTHTHTHSHTHTRARARTFSLFIVLCVICFRTPQMWALWTVCLSALIFFKSVVRTSWSLVWRLGRSEFDADQPGGSVPTFQIHRLPMKCSRYTQHIGTLVRNYTASHPGRHWSLYLPPSDLMLLSFPDHSGLVQGILTTQARSFLVAAGRPSCIVREIQARATIRSWLP